VITEEGRLAGSGDFFQVVFQVGKCAVVLWSAVVGIRPWKYWTMTTANFSVQCGQRSCSRSWFTLTPSPHQPLPIGFAVRPLALPSEAFHCAARRHVASRRPRLQCESAEL